jgi:hypothetical protein
MFWAGVPYLRRLKTTSGATAVQIVHSSRRGSRDIEHLGSGHDDTELELLKAAGRPGRQAWRPDRVSLTLAGRTQPARQQFAGTGGRPRETCPAALPVGPRGPSHLAGGSYSVSLFREAQSHRMVPQASD